MNNIERELKIEEKLTNELKHHLSGWHSKISEDFSKENFDKELFLFKSDPVYSKFGFATPEYVLVCLMGRISISVGRRLGEIYDKVPRFITSARFNLEPKLITPVFGGLELDICIPIKDISKEDFIYVSKIFTSNFPESKIGNGIGIEIRYNFNPNDSSRLRKDEKMVSLLLEQGLFPVYLIFSEISPRDEAIARLKRAGWKFFVGKDAIKFMSDLIGMDFGKILDRPKIKENITAEVDSIMKEMLDSPAFKQGAKIK